VIARVVDVAVMGLVGSSVASKVIPPRATASAR
jgi:hypothetical protein